MARWRLKLQEELPEVFNEVQKDSWDFSQAHAFCRLRDAYRDSIKQRETALTKRIIQFAGSIIEEGRNDTRSILTACFVEHIYDDLDREDITYLNPLLANSILLKFSRTIPLCSNPQKQNYEKLK